MPATFNLKAYLRQHDNAFVRSLPELGSFREQAGRRFRRHMAAVEMLQKGLAQGLEDEAACTCDIAHYGQALDRQDHLAQQEWHV